MTPPTGTDPGEAPAPSPPAAAPGDQAGTGTGPGGEDAAPGPRRPRLRRIVLTVVGWMFLVLGVLGLFLPILQGFLFLAVGLVILSRVSPRVQRFEAWLRLRSPRIDRTLHQGEKYLRLWRGRLRRTRRRG